jgi:asparagine synthase (glutamine-hydrolysing)
MCGILGIVDRQSSLSGGLVNAAERMRAALAHRGPDGWGLSVLDGGRIEERSPEGPSVRARAASRRRSAVIGHHRLAIIDVSPGGHQPQSTPDDRYWITYNGEIYNFRELRHDLEAAGQRFRSASDTEVLLALYVREGPAALDRLRGMFALAIWDDVDGTLFLARDRFGMKPLCWTSAPGGAFLFASEPKALLATGLVTGRSSPDADALFLRRGFMPAQASYYREIVPVAPGHWTRWNGAQLITREYWPLASALALSGGPESSARRQGRDPAAAVRQALAASARAHLVGDVPVGVFLSGGLDSTAVVAAAREVHDGPLRTFTVALPDSPLDESALARQAAQHYGTDHTEVVLTAERFFAEVDRFIASMDEPTADGINTFVVARAAREAGLKVVLSGVGGDEMLGGYDSFVRIPRLDVWLRLATVVPGAPGLLARAAGAAPSRLGPKLAEMFREAPASLPDLWRTYRALFTHAQLRVLLPDTGRAASTWMAHRDEARDAFWGVARCEIEEFLIPQLLRDADAFTMAWGLELRTPFVDHEFLAAVRRAGPWPRRRGESYKASLFRQMGAFLPASHLCRRKQGFILPIDRWLREALGAARPRDEAIAALRRNPAYRPITDGFLRGRVHWSRPWALYVLQRFHERFPA